MGKRWTDKEDGILETLRDGGMTFEEVASIMGRTKQAVQQRAYMLKRNEPTFREVVDTAFEKHGIEFGEPDGKYAGMVLNRCTTHKDDTKRYREYNTCSVKWSKT